MRIIHSYWPCGARNLAEAKTLSGGWQTPHHHYTAWAASCLMAKRYYSEVVLYTNQIGADLLVGELKLPYSEVVIVPQELLDSFDPRLWAMLKVWVYAQQQEPFVHIDGDVFLLQGLTVPSVDGGRQVLLGQPDAPVVEVLVQQEEDNLPYWVSTIPKIKKQIVWLPPALRYDSPMGVRCYNAGLLGGSNVAFIQKYANQALTMLEGALRQPELPWAFPLMWMAEQQLIYELSRQENVPVTPLLPPVYDMGDFAPLSLLPPTLPGQTFLHLLSLQKNSAYCSGLVTRFLAECEGDWSARVGWTVPLN